MCADDDVCYLLCICLSKYCSMALQYLSRDKIRFINIAGNIMSTCVCFVFFYSSISISSFCTNSSLKDKSCFYDLTDRDMDGNEVKMDKFKGDVLCVVNVASK